MIEPTETESRETLDAFADAMIEIARLIRDDPQKIKDAPVTTALSPARPDEGGARHRLRRVKRTVCGDDSFAHGFRGFPRITGNGRKPTWKEPFVPFR